MPTIARKPQLLCNIIGIRSKPCHYRSLGAEFDMCFVPGHDIVPVAELVCQWSAIVGDWYWILLTVQHSQERICDVCITPAMSKRHYSTLVFSIKDSLVAGDDLLNRGIEGEGKEGNRTSYCNN